MNFMSIPQTDEKNSLWMGIVADDVTGANDIGIMFAKAGCVTNVYSLNPAENAYDIDKDDLPDVAILNTNSRADKPAQAYKKVYQATRILQKLGYQQFYKKTCSVFRGNIGAEFDAMLDALGVDFGVVILGFPKNGRVTRDGIHYVHGKKLENSEFQNDPIHPMRQSNLVEILGSQTQRKVGLINYRIIDKGVFPLREAINARRSQDQYVILDVLDQDALKTIARAVSDELVLCGSSALGEELPSVWKFVPSLNIEINLPRKDNLGILVVAGSLMPQTLLQIKTLHAKGVPGFELLIEQLFDKDDRDLYINHVCEKLIEVIVSGSDAMLYSTNTHEEVEKAIQKGLEQGYSRKQISNLVSEALAIITARVISVTGQNRFIIAGGETSAAVCNALAIFGMRVWQEIQPGLPSCISFSEPRQLFVLKSGSFGKPDFFEKALDHLKSTEVT